MFGENRLRYNRTNAAWLRESSKSNDEMNEKDDKITHLGYRIKIAKCRMGLSCGHRSVFRPPVIR